MPFLALLQNVHIRFLLILLWFPVFDLLEHAILIPRKAAGGGDRVRPFPSVLFLVPFFFRHLFILDIEVLGIPSEIAVIVGNKGNRVSLFQDFDLADKVLIVHGFAVLGISVRNTHPDGAPCTIKSTVDSKGYFAGKRNTVPLQSAAS